MKNKFTKAASKAKAMFANITEWGKYMVWQPCVVATIAASISVILVAVIHRDGDRYVLLNKERFGLSPIFDKVTGSVHYKSGIIVTIDGDRVSNGWFRVISP